MNLTLLPLFNWDAGVIGAIFMFAVFLGLVVAIMIFMFGSKKK